MNTLGAQETSFSILQDPEIWKATDRWDDEKIDNWFKTDLKNGTTLGLAFTHEEPFVRAVQQHVSSYRDLPMSTYHFQTKLRNELRAKSGIMRGREFVMKDLYSFHTSQSDLDQYYTEAGVRYENVFRRVGIGDVTFLTFASGGVFSKFSHEFQTISAAGEDTVYIDREKRIAVNEEVMTDEVLQDLGLERGKLEKVTGIEVGNIFKLGTKYSEPLGLTYKDQDGMEKPVIMGCYGLGLGRLLGTVVEVLGDEKGIVWPDSIAPFHVHLVDLSNGDEAIKKMSDDLYADLVKAGVEVLYDDRDLRAGEKFADSDLVGIPYRIIVGKQSTPDSIEVVRRKDGNVEKRSRQDIINGAYAI